MSNHVDDFMCYGQSVFVRDISSQQKHMVSRWQKYKSQIIDVWEIYKLSRWKFRGKIIP